ncbi:MAG: hypothetical protein ACRD1P_04200 [Thermoanaerobaculia bacterium]
MSNEKDQQRLNSPEGLVAEIREHLAGVRWNSERKLYCWNCREERRVEIRVALRAARGQIYAGNAPDLQQVSLLPGVLKDMAPAVLRCQCIQCYGLMTVVVYETTDGADGAEIATLLAYTPPGPLGTPKAVAFYLDQARRALAQGANSAVVAMYRSALDQVLFDQNYKTGTVGEKINSLKSDREKGAAPLWAEQLDETDLNIIKQLGDGAVHARMGDVAKQKELDDTLVESLDAFFAHLLYEVYEHSATRKQLREELARTAQQLSAGPKAKKEP